MSSSGGGNGGGSSNGESLDFLFEFPGISKYTQEDIEFNPLTGRFDLIQRWSVDRSQRAILGSISIELDERGEYPRTSVLTDESTVIYDEIREK